MKDKIIIEIDIYKLVNWFWGSREDRDQLACEGMETIEDGEEFSMSFESAWESLGYIPAHILTNNSLEKYDIDECQDLEEWKHFDDIHDYIFLTQDGKKV